MIPLHDDAPAHRTPWVVRSVVGLCVLVFLYQLVLDERAEVALIYQFGMIPAALFGHGALPADLAVVPPVLTLVTTIFLHGGFMHLIGNMLFLWVFGDNVESAMGHWRFVAFLLLTGAIAALCHGLWDTTSEAPLIGASGAVSGVLGGYIILYPRARILVGIPIGFLFIPLRLPALVLLGLWFGLQVLNVLRVGSESDPIAWFAHVGGFLAGAALVLLFRDRDHPILSKEKEMALAPFGKDAAIRILRPEPHPDSPYKRGPWG
ncbi:MAG: hypothetical protein TEF_21175 [Rhizobiales bacterium NRL2]|jgi:membrane associated rhomboid family serine protease|nr:MAG: hypothetical protein TEF_21175 [Rhizobiales bacterium NRL2]